MLYVIYRTLENEYLACLSEKMSLQNRLSELEKDMSSTQKPIKFNSKTKNMTEDDLSNDSRKDKIECINNTINEKKDIGQEEKTQSAITVIKIIYNFCNILLSDFIINS